MRFSIVLPAYNVAPFIGEALEDLTSQTYLDFEAIVVDDCSTDDTLSIAQDFAKKDERFLVIHQEKNQGVSVARNTGMKAAKGEYILFFDPDDRYEHTLLEIVDKKLSSQKNVDVLVYSLFEDYYKNGVVEYTMNHSQPDGFYSERNEMANAIAHLERETMLGYPWNKAYRLSFLRENNLEYPIITHVEDILFNISVMKAASNLMVASKQLYHYRNQGQVRLTAKYLPEYLMLQKKRIEAFVEMNDEWNTASDYVLETAAALYFRSFFSAIEREIAAGHTYWDVENLCKTEYASELFLRLKGHLVGGKSVGLLYSALIDENTKKAYRRAKIVSFVKKNFPGVFAKAKQAR